jgi:FADH2 O2-dependent halogenase
VANELNLREGAPGWHRLLARLPAVQAQFAQATAVREFIYAPRLPYLSGSVVDRHWALLPSAAGFIDPLLSTGFPLTLLGLRRLACILEEDWESERFGARLFDYSMRTTMELATTARLVGALYAAMKDFELFAALSRLYFAAASFTETTWRLGRPEVAGDAFLLSEHPVFGPRFRYCVDSALRGPVGAERQQLMERIYQTIEPVDVAGLGDRSRRNWHPALVSDLIRAAPKLSASEADIQKLAVRCGLSEANDHGHRETPF